MPRSMMRACVASAALPIVLIVARPMMEVDLFRAWQASQVYRFEIANNNLADVGGVLKYIHTEIVVESEQDTDRENRKYDIDVIAYARFRVRNTDSIVESTHQREKDFGPFSAYDMGESTQDDLDELYETHSDMVGLQPVNGDPRVAFARPIYWFSVSGFCPNLPFGEKGTLSEPNEECLRYGGADGDVLTGGLCPEIGSSVLLRSMRRRLEMERIDPTGQPGCVYSYNEPLVIRIDELAGLTAIDCGGRWCTDWMDFRQNCTRGDLKFMFNRDFSGAVQPVDFCVEYDIHPWCARDCSDPRCQELMEAGDTPIEYGVAFWQGRCSPRATERRMEELAGRSVLPEMGTHLLVDPTLLLNAPACDCEGVPPVGINYCDRAFSGVCATCKIPGCNSPSDAPQPLCTLDVLSRPDYQGRADRKPLCATTVPTDLCCLYTGECEGSSDPQLATLDDNGLQLVRARRSTEDMVTFLERAAAGSSHTITDLNGLTAAAYEEWGTQPIMRSLESTLERLSDFMAYSPTTSTTAPTTQAPTTQAPTTQASTTQAPTTQVDTHTTGATSRPAADLSTSSPAAEPTTSGSAGTAAPSSSGPASSTATPDGSDPSTERTDSEDDSGGFSPLIIVIPVLLIALGVGISYYLAQVVDVGERGIELPDRN